MRIKVFYSFILIMSITAGLSAQEAVADKKTISYDNYIAEIEKSLPELKSNEMNILSAENRVKAAKAGGDISLNAGGTVYSQNAYSGYTDSGDVKGYNYYAGLSKKITSTGTNLSATYNYSQGDYSNLPYGTTDTSAFSPSFTVKVTQPLLYNFLGKVDSYSEDNAKMQLEIAKSMLGQNNKSVLNSYKKLYFQWVMYREIVKNLDEAISNLNVLKTQIKKKVDAGLSDNDDYQNSLASVLLYEHQRTEYQTALKNVENRLGIYIDINAGTPDQKVFNEYYEKVKAAELVEVNFKNTTSAQIMDLTIKNYAWSKGVYENRLLPELNVFAGATKKELSQSQTYGMKDTDYSVGFEFKYSLENNAAESSLKDIDIKLKSLDYEYKATENSYRKAMLSYIDSVRGINSQLDGKEKTLKARESQLVTEKKKYSQARLPLAYVITTENNITSERTNIISLRYQMIGYYIDYMDLVK